MTIFEMLWVAYHTDLFSCLDLEAPIEDLGIIKKDGKLWVDVEDNSFTHVAGGASSSDTRKWYSICHQAFLWYFCTFVKFLIFSIHKCSSVSLNEEKSLQNPRFFIKRNTY